MQPIWRISSVTAVIFGVLVSAAGAGETRTWTDSSGKFKVEAEYVSQDGTKVRLKKTANGKKLTIPVKKLCEEDQKYLETLREEENPFEAAEEESENTESSENAEDEGKNVRSQRIKGRVTARNSNVRTGAADGAVKILIGGECAGWKVKPEIIPAGKPTLPAGPVAIRTDPSLERVRLFTEEHLFFSDVKSRTALSTFHTPAFDGDKDFIEFCDLEKGTSKFMELPFRATICDFSADGTSILCIFQTLRSGGPFFDKQILRKLELQGDDLVSVNDFRPYYPQTPPANVEHIRADIDDAKFVDENRVFTSTADSMTLWNLEDYRAIYTLNVSLRKTVFSPDRKYMAFSSEKQVEIRQTSDGKLCGVIPIEGTVLCCAFDVTGGKLAVLGNTSLHVYDLTDGKTLYNVPVTASTGASRLLWTGETTILVDKVLFDLKTGVPACDYGLASNSPATFYDGRVWNVFTTGFPGRDRVTALVGTELPHEAVSEKLKGLNMEEVFAVYPGVKMKITVNLNGFADEEEARKILTERLAERKITVSDDAELEAVLSYSDSGVENEYSLRKLRTLHGIPMPSGPRMMRPSVSGDSVKLKVFLQSLEILENGKSVWKEQRQVTGPDRIDADSKKTPQEQFTEANKPDADFVKKVPVPGYVTRNSEGATALMKAVIQSDGSVK